MFYAIQKTRTETKMERVEFLTEDSVAIVGTWNHVDVPNAWAVLLLHMMPADRKSWEDFSALLTRKGMHTLAIDLRGHGESYGGPQGYRNFSDKELQKSIFDVETAVAFLKSKNVEEVLFAGASIGASLALWYLAEHKETKAGILLSPGFDYRGIRTKPLVERLNPGQAVLYVGDTLDKFSSGESCADVAEELWRLTPTGVDKEKIILTGAGHGTTMLEREAGLSDRLQNWLNKESGV